jgi:uncharacterized protein
MRKNSSRAGVTGPGFFCLPGAVACLPAMALATAGLLAISGCSIPIPQAEKDPTRYYVLGPTTTATATSSQSDAPVLHLRSVELASYLGSRPLIVRRGDNEIEFREFARWGESLDAGITRVLREDLIARGAVRAVLASGARRETAAPDFNLSVRVLACEGEAGGGVAFRAVWELARAGESSGTVASGDFRATGLRWDGKNEGSLAAALSQAVAGLAGEIANALKK